MPEYFMPAFVLDHLGNEITATLETNFATLVRWNAAARKRKGLPLQVHDKRLLSFAEQLEGRRVDMVLFEGEEEHKPKDQQDFFALLEFKRGWLGVASSPGKISDRDKLLMVLAHIDTCPWGVVCGCMNAANFEWQRNELTKTPKDRWYEKRIEMAQGLSEPLFFCARVFARSSDEERIEELLRTIPVSAPSPTHLDHDLRSTETGLLEEKNGVQGPE